jgi:hypothetical protein
MRQRCHLSFLAGAVLHRRAASAQELRGAVAIKFRATISTHPVTSTPAFIPENGGACTSSGWKTPGRVQAAGMVLWTVAWA